MLSHHIDKLKHVEHLLELPIGSLLVRSLSENLNRSFAGFRTAMLLESFASQRQTEVCRTSGKPPFPTGDLPVT
jgi:hypothetical protein